MGPAMIFKDPYNHRSCTGRRLEIFLRLRERLNLDGIREAAGYCLDAPESVPAGSTVSAEVLGDIIIRPALAER
jgi:hypothetical protein